MKDLKLSQCFSLIALNAQDAKTMTVSKKVSLNCMAAAVILEAYLEGCLRESQGQLILDKSIFNNQNTMLYTETVFKSILKMEKDKGNFSWWLTKAANLSQKDLANLEKTMVDSLEGEELIEEIPNLLGCALYYDSMDVDMKEYRTKSEVYTRIIESIRAEILEEGPVSDETIFMLWLLRESACFQEVFSNKELEEIVVKMNELSEKVYLAKILFKINIYHGLEIAIKKFLRAKKNAMKTPTGIGLNFVFPWLERSQSVFIDTEEWFSNPKQRLEAVTSRLAKGGHRYEVMRGEKIVLIKIDNILYEAIPTSTGGRTTIHGVRLRRYPN